MTTQQEVWIKAWCATANANDCKSPSVATSFADKALTAFLERFPEAEEEKKVDGK